MSAGTEEHVEIPVSLQTYALLAELRTLNNKFDEAFKGMAGSATETNSKLELIKKGFNAIRMVAGFVKDVIVDYAGAAIQAERNERRWMIAMQLRERVTRQQLAAQKALVDEISQATAIDDDALLNLQEQLALMGIRNAKMTEATKATIGLAQITGSLDGAARLYARTQNGQVEALKRYGIQAKSASDATKKLLELYQLATDETKTLGGQIKLLDINYGNFQETLGSSVTKSDVAYEGMKALNDITVQFTDYLGSKEGQDLVNGFFDLMIVGAQMTLTTIEGLVRSVDFLYQRIRENYALATDGFYTEQLDEHGNVVQSTLAAFADQIRIAEGKLQAARERAAAGKSDRSDTPATPRPTGYSKPDTSKDDAKREKELEDAVRKEIEYHEKLNAGELEAERRRNIQREKALDERDHLRLREINAENEKKEFYDKLHADERAAAIRHNQEMRDALVGRLDDQKRLLGQLVDISANALTSIVEQFLTGSVDARAAAEAFFGSVLQGVGRYLIGLGAANIVGGAWPPNPVQIAAGVAQVALGAAMAGGGAYLSGAAGRRSDAAREREKVQQDQAREREREAQERDRVRRERSAGSSSGGAFGTSKAPINVYYNLQLQGFGVGSPASFGRMTIAAARAADRLSSGRLSIGG